MHSWRHEGLKRSVTRRAISDRPFLASLKLGAVVSSLAPRLCPLDVLHGATVVFRRVGSYSRRRRSVLSTGSQRDEVVTAGPVWYGNAQLACTAGVVALGGESSVRGRDIERRLRVYDTEAPGVCPGWPQSQYGAGLSERTTVSSLEMKWKKHSRAAARRRLCRWRGSDSPLSGVSRPLARGVQLY